MLKSPSPRLRSAEGLVPVDTLMLKSASRSQEEVQMNGAYLILGGGAVFIDAGRGRPLALIEAVPWD